MIIVSDDDNGNSYDIIPQGVFREYNFMENSKYATIWTSHQKKTNRCDAKDRKIVGE